MCLLCMHEMNVEGALPLCIRILIHANTDVAQHQVRHIYLNDAIEITTRFGRESN